MLSLPLFMMLESAWFQRLHVGTNGWSEQRAPCSRLRLGRQDAAARRTGQSPIGRQDLVRHRPRGRTVLPVLAAALSEELRGLAKRVLWRMSAWDGLGCGGRLVAPVWAPADQQWLVRHFGPQSGADVGAYATAAQDVTDTAARPGRCRQRRPHPSRSRSRSGDRIESADARSGS